MIMNNDEQCHILKRKFLLLNIDTYDWLNFHVIYNSNLCAMHAVLSGDVYMSELEVETSFSKQVAVFNKVAKIYGLW